MSNPTRKVYFAFDGVNYTDVSADAVSATIIIGKTSERQAVADVGTCTLVLKNDTRNYSPEFTAGLYYGSLNPNIPVKVELVTDYDTRRLFTGFVVDWLPDPDLNGPLRCTVNCQDYMGRLQEIAIALPLQMNQTVDSVIRKVTSEASQSGVASGLIYMRKVVNGDTVTVGSQAYTFRNALTPVAGEVALESRDYGNTSDPGTAMYGAIDAGENLAAAINRDTALGTDYVSISRHTLVTAQGYMGLGVDESLQDTAYDLQRSTTNYEAIAASFRINDVYPNEPEYLPLRRIYLYLKKTGSPTGTLTIRLETTVPVTYEPTGNLYHANGTATLSEASLAGSYAWYAIDFTEFDIFKKSNGASNRYAVVMTTNRAASATDYVTWGAATNSYPRFARRLKTAGSWDGHVFDQGPLIFVPAIVDLKGNAHGAFGNIALATTSARAFVSGATLTGGVDGPAGLFAYENGILTLDYAADTWQGEVNAMSCLEELVASEPMSHFWVSRSGVLTFKNQQYQFSLANTTPALVAGDGNFNGQVSGLFREDIANRITVAYRPRDIETGVVVAKTSKTFWVSGRSGRAIRRYNKTELILDTSGWTGERTITLPYVDTGTAESIGATDLIPPVGGTDFNIYDNEAGTGLDYSSTGRIVFSAAEIAGAIQVHISNKGLRPLYIHNLQVRGTALKRQDVTQETLDDSTSMAAYGIRNLEATIPYPSSNVSSFANLLAAYLLAENKDPHFKLRSISFRGLLAVGSMDIYALEIGDLIQVSESQTFIQNYKMMIIGLEYQLPETDVETATFHLMRVGRFGTYGQVERAGYGELDSTARLAL